MTSKLHRIHIPNVGECIMPKGSGYPYAPASLTCPAGFEIGDVIRIGKKTFVLAKTGGAITSIGLAVKNGLAQGVANCSVQAAAAAGATSVNLSTVATDGSAGTGLIATDEFKGGEIVLFTAGSDIPQRRGITGNTSRTASGTKTVTFYLDSPLTTALGTGDSGEAMQSPWSYVVQDTQIGHPVVGVPTVIAAAADYYLWLQTWGLTFVSPQANVGVAGAGIGCYWRHDGSIDTYANIGTYVSTQYAGFVVAEAAAHTQGAPFFMLQIQP
jgi:hypothetical protein